MSEPIFIHSLFRSGSTWLFDVFRRANAGYWCYQEPFHENLSLLASDPESVLSYHEEVARSLRHPGLNQPYFYEIHALRAHVGDSFQSCISYRSFFDTTACPALDDYTSRLIRHAKGRPVLQCCRSFGRVAHLRQRHGGVHIHLWRNPRDQWWSYQTNDYFDTTSLAILHAQNPPAVIGLLRQELGVDAAFLLDHEDDFAALGQIPVSFEHRYLAFYGLWLYSLIENRPHADVDVNIDQLTADVEYRARVMALLEDSGITGLDFSTCAVPQAQFGPEDHEFFRDVERRVHQLFTIAGYDIVVLRGAIEQQAAAQPNPALSRDAAIRDAMRSRGIARRYAHRALVAMHHQLQEVTRLRHAERERDEALAKAGAAKTMALQAGRQAQAAERRANQAKVLAEQAKTQALAAETHAMHTLSERDKALAEAGTAHVELQRVYASRSWRITSPLRRMARLLKSLLRPFVLAAMRLILRHARIRAACLYLLKPFPRITSKLRALALHRALLKSPDATQAEAIAEQAKTRASADAASAISPRAMRIYTRICAARAGHAFRGHH